MSLIAHSRICTTSHALPELEYSTSVQIDGRIVFGADCQGQKRRSEIRDRADVYYKVVQTGEKWMWCRLLQDGYIVGWVPTAITQRINITGTPILDRAPGSINDRVSICCIRLLITSHHVLFRPGFYACVRG
jgi:hypothetical protein